MVFSAVHILYAVLFFQGHFVSGRFPCVPRCFVRCCSRRRFVWFCLDVSRALPKVNTGSLQGALGGCCQRATHGVAMILCRALFRIFRTIEAISSTNLSLPDSPE